MKPVLKIFFLYLLSVSFASGSGDVAGLADWAKSDLQTARENFSKAESARGSERKKLSAELSALGEKLASLQKRIDELEQLKRKAENTGRLLQYKESRAKEMAYALSACAGSDDIPGSLSNFSSFAEKIMARETSKILSPELPQKCDVSDLRGDILSGESFRVGAFRYFVSGDRAGFLSADSVLYGEDWGRDIRNFFEGKSDAIPADLSGGELYKRERSGGGIASDIARGGVWMWPIAFFGLISLGVCVLKAFSFSRLRRAPDGTVKRICTALDSGDEGRALKLSESLGEPYSDMLSELIKSRGLGQATLEELSYEYMLRAGDRLFSKLSILSVSAAVSPLFGLLGTVTGIIKTFGGLSTYGAEQARAISAGISEALITTEYGLVVAIPAFVAHVLFSRRAKAIISDMEKIASGFLGALEK